MAVWRQEYKKIQVAAGAGVVIDINSADDTVYVSLNGDIVGAAGLRASKTLNENLTPSLQAGANVLVVSLYNDNRAAHRGGKGDSPASMDASLSVGANKYNLSYSTRGDHSPGLVTQHVFLLNK
jgi:hypothetical protein